jgi:outer membrane protein assembly factor BamB
LNGIASSFIITLLFLSLFAFSSTVQPTKVVVSSQAGFAQTTSPDWWPMFHHDLTRSGCSTSSGPNTNQTLWKYKTAGFVFSSPAVVNGIVFVGSYDNSTYALNAVTGTLVWKYPTRGGVVSSPAVAGGVVYVGSVDHNVYALNATTGTPMWNYKTGDCVESSPVVANGRVYVGSGYTIYALNAATGTLSWKYTPVDWINEPIDFVYSSPAVVGGTVYVSGYYSNVYALNAATGALVWEYPIGCMSSSPAVANGVVYLNSLDNNVYALNAATGAFVWKRAIGSFESSSPAVAGGIVFVGSYDDKTYALNSTTGTLVWSFTANGIIFSSPAVAGGVVYVGSDDDNVYALNITTGALVWKYRTGGFVESSPAIAGGVVYVGSWDDNVYAFGVPLSATISPASVTSDVGQSQLFASSVTGGRSPYSYQWYLNGVAVSSAIDSTWIFTSPFAGFYTVYVEVTDAAGFTATSNTANLTLNPTPSVSISPKVVITDVGESQTFTSTVYGGTSPYTYQWYLDGVAVSFATNASWSFTPGSSRACTIYVIVADSLGFWVKSNVVSVTLDPAQLSRSTHPRAL